MSDFELRRRLAQLPREMAPQHDLWPGVSARIAPRAVARRKRSRWLGGFALAASLTLVAVLALAPDSLHRSESPQLAGQHPMLIEADALATEFEDAMRALGPIAFPPELMPVVDDLDTSLASLHQALRDDPAAGFLLDQLRRTYSHRLRLTQRAITQWTWAEPVHKPELLLEQPNA